MTNATTIVVTGATGTIGSNIVDLLTAEPQLAIRAATRDPRAQPRRDGVTWTTFDWDAPTATDELVADAAAVFVLPPPAHPPQRTTERLIDAALAASVGHMVFLSTFGANFDPGFAFGRWALETERVLAQSRLSYTVLRPNSYMTNFLTNQRPDSDGAIRLPWRDGATSFVDPRDVAAVAARVLLEPHHHVGATYELTGPDALDLDAVATLLAAADGEAIRYVDVSPDVVRAALSDRGMPAPMVTALMELHEVMASGERGVVTDDVERVLRRPPRSFAAFAAEQRARRYGVRPMNASSFVCTSASSGTSTRGPY